MGWIDGHRCMFCDNSVQSPLVRIQTEKCRLESEREQLKDSIAQSECDQQKLHDSILALGADLDILGGFPMLVF